MPGVGQFDHRRGATDPVELARIVLHAGRIKRLLDRQHLRRDGDRGAVARRLVVEPAGHVEPTCSRHIDRYDRRIAGNVAAQIPRDEAAIEIVAAAHGIADVEIDRVVSVEILDRISRRGAHHQRRDRRDQPKPLRHAGSSRLVYWPIVPPSVEMSVPPDAGVARRKP